MKLSSLDKEGEGLGRKSNGVLNPITPDVRYHCSKMGLGTPVEVRMGITTTTSNTSSQEWPQGIQSDSPEPWALPSYLNKKNYKKGNFEKLKKNVNLKMCKKFLKNFKKLKIFNTLKNLTISKN